MAYNHLRMNIRNFMVGMNLTEARAYRDRITADFVLSAEHIGYIDEFIRELEAEVV